MGLIVVVTGGGGGLGAAICRTLGAAGMTVIAADIRLDRAEDVADGVRRAGGKASARLLDVTDSQQAGEVPGKDQDIDAVSRPTRPYVEMSVGMGLNGFPAISMTQQSKNEFQLTEGPQ